MVKKTDKKNEAQVETTGHEWDGIQEYNNPLPRWWLWVFIVTIIFSIGYCIYYPSIPLLNGFTKGTANWSQYEQLKQAQEKAAEKQVAFNEKIASMDAKEIMQDPELFNFAFAAGKAQFSLTCSQCHGAGGGGAKGYPNLLDNEWIWGGEIDEIIATITHGIRSYDDDMTHDNVMMAYGKEEVLTADQIADVTRYIKVISENFLPNEASSRGEEIFIENCAACHGEGGIGNQEMGAPALNNKIWLYGGHSDDIKETITEGRGGHMPAFGKILSKENIKKVAIYVHSLGGGE